MKTQLKIASLILILALSACGGSTGVEEDQAAENDQQEVSTAEKQAEAKTPELKTEEPTGQENPEGNKVQIVLKNTQLDIIDGAVFSVVAPPSPIASLQFDIKYDRRYLELKSQAGPVFGVQLGADVAIPTRLSVTNPIPGRLRIIVNSPFTPIIETENEIEIVTIRFYLQTPLPLKVPLILTPRNIVAEDLNQSLVPVQLEPLTIGP